MDWIWSFAATLAVISVSAVVLVVVCWMAVQLSIWKVLSDRFHSQPSCSIRRRRCFGLCRRSQVIYGKSTSALSLIISQSFRWMFFRTPKYDLDSFIHLDSQGALLHNQSADCCVGCCALSALNNCSTEEDLGVQKIWHPTRLNKKKWGGGLLIKLSACFFVKCVDLLQ